MSQPAPWRSWSAALVIAALAFGGGMLLSHFDRAGNGPRIDGLLWPDPPQVEQVALSRADGRSFGDADLRGHWSLVFFGFTHCPDVCPTTLDVMARAHRALKGNPHYGARGQVVFVSVDPERDSGPRLAEYARHFDPEFVALTAPVERLTPLTRRLGVIFGKVAQAGSDYTVDHSAGIFFLDPALRLVSVLTPPHDVASVVARFEQISAFIESTL